MQCEFCPRHATVEVALVHRRDGISCHDGLALCPDHSRDFRDGSRYKCVAHARVVEIRLYVKG